CISHPHRESPIGGANPAVPFRGRMGRTRASWLGLAVLLLTAALAFAGSGAGAGGDVGWNGWGNTPDNMRLSPLTLVTKSNIDQLGRIYTVNFRTFDAIARLGEQSYPVIKDGVMYVTTGEGKVYALDAATGKLVWKWYPDNVAVFNK